MKTMKSMKNRYKVSNTNGLPFPKSIPKVPQKYPKNSTFGDFLCFRGLFGRKSGRFWEKKVGAARTEELDYSAFFPENIDFQTVMLNLIMRTIEGDVQAMKFARVSNGEIANEE